ncbi:uncharacterized protein Dwil_GK27657 [Drosophila willistoni]|uniref:Secreted protein n=1 Tax=Drosophila willistoni TaxID=7260 RepID=A0A0Q9WPX6_DROWI|nr:uncharacterized protein Dwil_GK27657 [Drosophila willistoni]
MVFCLMGLICQCCCSLQAGLEQNELFALHLSYQNTEIRIFGTFALNHRLLFLSATVIVLHVLYMVQCDMT